MHVKSKERRFISIGEAVLFTGLDFQTLRKLADTEKIRCYRTPSGQRRFDRQSLEAMCNPPVADEAVSEGPPSNFLYARVSTAKQMDDLSRQIEYLRSLKPQYATYTVVSDVASGINFKRKGLSAILDACIHGTIGEVVVAHRERLSRFGFDLINLIVTKAGGRVSVVQDDHNRTSEQELAEDLLSIVHIYSCRQMGKRSYKQRKEPRGNSSQRNADQVLSNRQPEEGD
jgi:predicted site-specific integrase-resolvase